MCKHGRMYKQRKMPMLLLENKCICGLSSKPRRVYWKSLCQYVKEQRHWLPLIISGLTWLHHPWLGSEISQVNIGLPAVNDGVGVLTGSVCSGAVCHGHLDWNGTKTEVWWMRHSHWSSKCSKTRWHKYNSPIWYYCRLHIIHDLCPKSGFKHKMVCIIWCLFMF